MQTVPKTGQALRSSVCSLIIRTVPSSHATSHYSRQFRIRSVVLKGEKKESIYSLVRVARDAQETLKTQYHPCKNGWQAPVFWPIASSNLCHRVRGKQTGITSPQTGQFKPFRAQVSLPIARLPCEGHSNPYATGPEWILFLVQLTPRREGLEWDVQWNDSYRRPRLPKQVEWAGWLKRRDAETKRLQAATPGPLSNILLRFALTWPPFNLQQARDGAEEVGRMASEPHQPHTRGHERVNVFAGDLPPPVAVEPRLDGEGYDRVQLGRLRFE